jgi:Xaa-Pro aminopeptidase
MKLKSVPSGRVVGEEWSRGSVALSEYRGRRERVLKSLKGAVGLVLAGEGPPPLMGRWRPHSHFYYLTGIADEHGAAVLFDATAEDPRRRCVLFLRPLDPEADRWDMMREEIGAALRQKTGFDTVMRVSYLPRSLTQAARRAKRLACLHAFAVYPAAVSPDLAVFRQVSERIPGVAIEDRTMLLPEMRSIKSKAEIAMMSKAAEATAAGYATVMKMIRPGVNEGQIAQTLESTYLQQGADGLAYNSIVGAGLNGTILHYHANSKTVEEGELIVIDSAAAYGGYASDVTRTFPASGRFTAEQREVYEVVLRAQLAAIKAARPGAKMSDVDAAGRGVIEKAGHGDHFPHGIGHQLGLEVHDVTPDTPLKPGMIVTIEPGVYYQDRKMGVRIEDDILITTKGNRNLTAGIAKTANDVEEAMSQG